MIGYPYKSVRTAVSAAVREGRLPRHPDRCTVCGAPGVEKRSPGKLHGRWSIVLHHWSYDPKHWLEVVAVCDRCHAGIHLGQIPEPLTGELRTGDRIKRGSGQASREFNP